MFAFATHLGLLRKLKKKRLHARDILKLKATRSGDADDWPEFKKLLNTVNKILKTCEGHYKHALNEYQGDPT